MVPDKKVIESTSNQIVRLLLLLVLISLVTPCWSQAKLTMNMRDADIRALIQWVADNTGKNIIVHKDVQGKVTVLSPQPLTSDEAYQVFLSVLQVHDYAVVETEQALKIIPNAIATGSGVTLRRGNHEDFVVSLIKVQHLPASQLAEKLKPLLSSNALITPYPASNSLVIADHASQIDQIDHLIRQLDAASDYPIEVIKLQHANADDVLASIAKVLPKEATAYGLQMAMDERSNSLLLTGPDSKRQQLKQLIKGLDTPLSGEGNTQVIYLHYIDAKEIAPILKSLAKTTEKEQKSSLAVSVEASASANALVVRAPPAILNVMKTVVKKLDIHRAQVLIESLVVEVSGDISEDLGVNWVGDNFNDNNDGVSIGVNTLGSLPLGSLTDNLGTGLTFGYFEAGNLKAALRALNTNQKTNILSTPTIVALDNEEASLLVGQNVPFITGQATSSSSSTNDPFTTIERQDIGISLQVTPRINHGDAVTLEIKQKTEDIISAAGSLTLEGASDIITNKREIITTALIKDNQVLVLGGLISDDEEEVIQKVPLLGDIPLLGNLFKSTSKSREKKNLMVFIHPIILKGKEQTEAISQRRYEFMRGLQKKSRQRPVNIDEQQPLAEDFNVFTPVNN